MRCLNIYSFVSWVLAWALILLFCSGMLWETTGCTVEGFAEEVMLVKMGGIINMENTKHLSSNKGGSSPLPSRRN